MLLCTEVSTVFGFTEVHQTLHWPNLASELCLLASGGDVEERMGQGNQEKGILMNRIQEENEY